MAIPRIRALRLVLPRLVQLRLVQLRLVQLRLVGLVLAVVAAGLLPAPTSVQAVNQPILGGKIAGFTQIAAEGFDDRQNSWPWAMQWWNGYLYVGTNRAWHCAETFSLNRSLPVLFPYPPEDPDVECPVREEIGEELGAEIWRYSPIGKSWRLVYESPRDVHIPGTIGRLAPRDVGFRGMAIFREPDGKEALYVGAVSPRFIWAEGPPPRILRSTDGLNFEAVPQTPGTLLYDRVDVGLRNPVVYKDKIYFISGSVQGSGLLLGAANPAGGNDEFQVINPPATVVSAVAVFNGYLYIGVQNLTQGFSILKTDASGPPPYHFTQVLSGGGYKPQQANHEVLSMDVFDGRLYVGGNGIQGIRNTLLRGLGGPAELLRINPDDTWDVVMGSERDTPYGWKFPISGFMPGFGNYFNGHIWRMAVFDNQLFVGTFDASTIQKDHPDRGPRLAPVMGFDLYRSVNGRDFIPVTRTGFEDKLNFGVRGLEVTPYGMFLGTANYYQGLQIWHLRSGGEFDGERAYLPLLTGGDGGGIPLAAAGIAGVEAVFSRSAPEHVEALARGGDTLLVWDAAAGAQHYEIWRGEPLITDIEDEDGSIEVVSAGWGDAQLVGETSETRWVDPGRAGSGAIYYVVSRSSGDVASGPSNLAVERAASVRALLAELDGMQWSGAGSEWTGARQAVERAAAGGDMASASQAVMGLQSVLLQPDRALLPGWQVKDALYLLHHLQRRIALVQTGQITLSIE